MTYIPKNRIITDLYTNNKELVYKKSKLPYIGYYWKSYDGKFFTGKNPNEKPTKELTKISQDNTENSLISTTQIATENNPNIDDISTYARLKNVDTLNPQKYIIPKHQYIKPTEDDYKLGVFDRYFLYKENESIFLEVNEKIFKAIRGNDSKYYNIQYSAFKLIWTLTGDEDYVYNTNKKIIELTENRIKRKGLKQFLKGNYTKFWLPK